MESIIALYEKRKQSFVFDQEARTRVDDAWQYFRDKIVNDTFTLEDFANTIPNIQDSAIIDKGGYLMNFLERTSSKSYGSSKPGNAFNYGIKMNNDNTTYTLVSNREEEVDHATAASAFELNIKPFLQRILINEDGNQTTIEQKIQSIESDDNFIPATQLLRKIAALEHPNDLMPIYQDSTIDKLFKMFCDNEDATTNLGKNYAIVQKLKSLFNDGKEFLPSELYILSVFLWRLENAQTIFDPANKNVILYGAPGTGKTFTVLEALELLTKGDSNFYKVIQFHPSYSYEDFIEGIRPTGIVGSSLNLQVVNGTFKEFCIKAKNDLSNDYYFVIDEINRGNLSSIFGELLFCLEYRYNPNDDRRLNLVQTQYSNLIKNLKDEKERLSFLIQNDEVYFGIPDNVYVIGMMNDVDKSIDSFDLALRRRFKWIRKECDYELISDVLSDYTEIEQYTDACKKLNQKISASSELNLGKSYEFGHAFFLKIKDISRGNKIKQGDMTILFDNYLQPTLKEYMRSVYAESDIDDKLKEIKESFINLVPKKTRKKRDQN
jgi:5-methylcytosine-specific restriction protein B